MLSLLRQQQLQARTPPQQQPTPPQPQLQQPEQLQQPLPPPHPPLLPPPPPPPAYNQAQHDFVRLLANEQSVAPPANAIHQFSVVRAHGSDGLTVQRVDPDRTFDDEVHIRDVSTVVYKHRSGGKKIATSLADAHFLPSARLKRPPPRLRREMSREGGGAPSHQLSVSSSSLALARLLSRLLLRSRLCRRGEYPPLGFLTSCLRDTRGEAIPPAYCSDGDTLSFCWSRHEINRHLKKYQFAGRTKVPLESAARLARRFWVDGDTQ